MPDPPREPTERPDEPSRATGSAARAPAMGQAALLLAGATLASRILGYLRDAVIAYMLGATAETDAYHAAFTLPDLMNYFLAGGALSITFIPIFGRFLAADDEERGWELFGVLVTVMGSLLAVGIALAWIFAPSLVPLLFPGFSDSQLALTVRLTRIILPGQLAFYVGGLLIATESAQKRFHAAALAPLVYNLAIIVGGVALAGSIGVAGFAWGALSGAFLGPLLLSLFFARRSVRFRIRFDPTHPGLRRFVALALPLMLGVTLLTVDEWYGRYFASRFDKGALTWLNNARRLMLVPVAFIGQAIGQAALPYLTLLVGRGEDRRMHAQLGDALRGGASLATIAAAALFVAALPATAIVFQRGAFTPEDAVRTAEVLRALAPTVIVWTIQTIAVRGFYARENTLLPMIAGTLVAIVSLPIYATLSTRFGLVGLAVATPIGLALNAATIVGLYDRRYASRLWLHVVRGLATGGLAGLPAAAVTWGLAAFLAPGRYETAWAALFDLIIIAAVFSLFALPVLARAEPDVAKRLAAKLPFRQR